MGSAINDLHRQIIDTAKSAGFSVYGDDFMGRFLAVLYVYGNEEFVMDKRLRAIARHGKDLILAAAWDRRADSLHEDALRVVSLFKKYHREIAEKRAHWLESFVKRLGVSVTSDMRSDFPA
jgi:hypothetical protein